MLNVQKPDHGAPVGSNGSGGTAPLFSPLVWVHDVGLRSLSEKSTLWALKPPAGYRNVTRPPGVIVTVDESSAGLENERLSSAIIVPSTSAALDGADASP